MHKHTTRYSFPRQKAWICPSPHRSTDRTAAKREKVNSLLLFRLLSWRENGPYLIPAYIWWLKAFISEIAKVSTKMYLINFALHIVLRVFENQLYTIYFNVEFVMSTKCCWRVMYSSAPLTAKQVSYRFNCAPKLTDAYWPVSEGHTGTLILIPVPILSSSE